MKELQGMMRKYNRGLDIVWEVKGTFAGWTDTWAKLWRNDSNKLDEGA